MDRVDPQSGTIRLTAVGDIALHQGYERHLVDGGKAFRDHLAQILPSNSPVIGNLESPLTRQERLYPQKCSLQADPSWAGILAQAGLRGVSLANNHIMDSGVEGLEETQRALDEAGILHGGAGANAHEARKPMILDIGSHKVGVLSYCSVPVNAPIWATSSTPGVARFVESELWEDVKGVRPQVDLVIVCLHWGLEHHRLPTPGQRSLARQMLEGGVDAVIGHHPHILQGVETWGEGKPAFYSLGNFLFSPTTWSGIGRDGEVFDEELGLGVEGRRGGAVVLEWSLPSGTPTWSWRGSRLEEDLLPRPDSGVTSVVGDRSAPLKRFHRIHWSGEYFRRESAARLGPWLVGGTSPRRLLRLRPRHIGKLARDVFGRAPK